MRYILCEDGESGHYFWSLIAEYVLKKNYHMITHSEIYELIKETPVDGTYKIGISKIRKFLQVLISDEYIDHVSENTYIICVDNVIDNIEVGNDIELIQGIVEEQDNFHLVNYICFEQLIINSPSVLSFFPDLAKTEEYNILRQHADTYGLGHGRELKRLLKKNKIKHSTTERIYTKIIEKAVIKNVQKFGKRDYITAVHHYILKGKWSVCWTTDCTQDCPDNRCWEATGNNVMCDNCNWALKDKSQSCIHVKADVVRKYAEEKSCDKQLPKKLNERFRLMFDIKEIKAIDNY